jgi:hypothetical protein
VAPHSVTVVNNSNWLGLAIVAVLLFLLAVTAVHLDPALAGVIGAILLGVAAVITAINRHRAAGGANLDPPRARRRTRSAPTRTGDETDGTDDDNADDDATVEENPDGVGVGDGTDDSGAEVIPT